MYGPLLSGPRLRLASALAMLVSWDVKQMEDVCVCSSNSFKCIYKSTLKKDLCGLYKL